MQFSQSNSESTANKATDADLRAEFGALWDEAERVWDTHQNERAFERFVSADYLAVARALSELRGHGVTFLEWGSGLGVATIMASHMGFDAFGIETELELIDRAEELADTFRSSAQFAAGSFIPDSFRWDTIEGDESQRTVVDVADAYGDLDMELRDFDLVYAYPWPDEHGLYQKIMQQFASRNALLLCYDVREGMQVTPFNQT